MNRNQTLLDLELRLLIARYGKKKITKALSEIGSTDLPVIKAGIEDYENGAKRSKAQHRTEKSIEEMVREVNPVNPDIAQLLEKLARAYKNKEFLPELRKVKQFLEYRDIPTSKIRSRRDALPIVLQALAPCSIDELLELDEGKRGSRSDLGIITDQILGHSNNAGGLT
ncbi:MAG: hypothetical protein F4Y91_09485 [Gemmatimonadetes bacterium]|nr:hypothetical protein [Gemmatimonadota bacterium]MXY82275.1 hypothetical protein [Gemmatimonadota bacterium]MYB71262.1 hypothetical protein [Gemmatimonadota bacterium]